MRRSDGEIEEGKRGAKAEISSSGFSLKPLVKVNEGCAQSSETHYITAPLINAQSVCVCLWVCVCAHSRACTHQYTVHVFSRRCERDGRRPDGKRRALFFFPRMQKEELLGPELLKRC